MICADPPDVRVGVRCGNCTLSFLISPLFRATLSRVNVYPRFADKGKVTRDTDRAERRDTLKILRIFYIRRGVTIISKVMDVKFDEFLFYTS